MIGRQRRLPPEGGSFDVGRIDGDTFEMLEPGMFIERPAADRKFRP